MEKLKSGIYDGNVERKNYNLIRLILLWCGLVIVSSLYITIPMIPIFSSAFKVDQSQASLTSSAFSFTYAFGFLIFTPLLEKIDKKKLMVIGLMALIIITLLMGVVRQFYLIVLLRAIQGLAASTFAPSVLEYIAEIFPVQQKVTAIGFVSTGFLMAGIVGQLFSGIVSKNLGWPYVFYLLSLIYLLSLGILFIGIPSGNAILKKVNILDQFGQVRSLIFKRNLSLSYFIASTLLLSFVGMYTVLGNYLSQYPFELNNNQILIVRAAGIIGMFMSPFAGKLVSSFKRKMVLKGGLLSATIGVASIGLINKLYFVVTMSIVFVGGIAIVIPTIISLIGELGGKSRSTAVSLYMFILFIGAALGPIIALNILKIGGYVLAFEILAAILFVSFLISFFLNINEKEV